MSLPSSLVITDKAYFLDGGTIILFAISDEGASHRICLAQRLFRTTPGAGCLYFDDDRVPTRSELERKVIGLLKDAQIFYTPRQPEPSDEPPISKDALILSDDIRQVLESEPVENIKRFARTSLRLWNPMTTWHLLTAQHRPPRDEKARNLGNRGWLPR